MSKEREVTHRSQEYRENNYQCHFDKKEKSKWKLKGEASGIIWYWKILLDYKVLDMFLLYTGIKAQSYGNNYH